MGSDAHSRAAAAARPGPSGQDQQAAGLGRSMQDEAAGLTIAGGLASRRTLPAAWRGAAEKGEVRSSNSPSLSRLRGPRRMRPCRGAWP